MQQLIARQNKTNAKEPLAYKASGQRRGCSRRRPAMRYLSRSHPSTPGYGVVPLVVNSHNTTPIDHWNFYEGIVVKKVTYCLFLSRDFFFDVFVHSCILRSLPLLVFLRYPMPPTSVCPSVVSFYLLTCHFSYFNLPVSYMSLCIPTYLSPNACLSGSLCF